MPSRGAPKAESFGCPSKPAGAFIIWSDRNREEIAAKLKATAIAEGKTFVENAEELKQAVQAAYKAITPEEKKVINKDAADRKKEWQEAKKAWEMSPEYVRFQRENAALNRKKALKEAEKKATELGKPKKCKTGYFIFMEEQSEAVRTQKKAEMGSAFKIQMVSLEMAKRWKEMPEQEKSVFNQKAQIAKEKYNKDLEEYKKTDHYKQYEAETSKAREEAKEHVKRARAEAATAKAEKRQRVKDEAKAAKAAAREEIKKARDEAKAKKQEEKEARKAAREAKRAAPVDGEAKPAAKRQRKTKTVTATADGAVVQATIAPAAIAPAAIAPAAIAPVAIAPVAQPNPIVPPVPAVVA